MNSENNSVTISGNGHNLQGSQFAQKSTEFKGTTNNTIGNNEGPMRLEELTSQLISMLQKDSMHIAQEDLSSLSEVSESVATVQQEVEKEKPNKISLKGILSGIKTTIGELNGISSNTIELYDTWESTITSLI